MKIEKNYDFRKRMCEVHRPDLYRKGAVDGKKGLLIDGRFSILLPKNAGDVARHAAHDLAECFRVSYGVELAVTEGQATPAIRLVLSADAADTAPSGSEERAYRTIVTGEGVTVTANTERGLFAATVDIEEQMAEHHAPFLSFADRDRRPLFSPRMVHSGYELDVFPEEYMNRLAHDGYDTLLVFVKGADLTPRGPADFNTLIATAARYGLDVYAYSYIVSEKHPLDEGAEEYYEKTYGRLFRENNGFRGVVFVGESCEFPSRDPRAYNHLFRYHPKGEPYKKFFSRNFPVSDYPDWLAMVKRIIRKYQPKADILFWSYNWGSRPAEERVALIDDLPLDISLQATFEMYEPIPSPEGVYERVTDYSIAIPGPGKYFLSEAEAAARRGLRLYTISNTAGTTWDVGIVPYIPAPAIWGERFDKLLECRDKYGLVGLMESHHYGAYHSFISELSKEMGWSPRRPFREHLEAIAIREFGKENLTDVLKAWEHASEGCRHNVPTIPDQYGPLRVGPAYPLCTRTKWVMPSPPFAHFGGQRITYAGYGQYMGFPGSNCLVQWKRILHEAAEFSIMRDELDKAAAIFAEVTERLTGREREEAGRMSAHLFLMARTAETTVNVKRFSMLRRMVQEWVGDFPIALTADEGWIAAAQEFYGVKALTPALIRALAADIVKNECENAMRAIPAVEYDSRLGYEPSMEYMCDREHILWKVECTNDALTELCDLLDTVQ